MPPWRLLLDGPASPARNMAIDEALLREIREPVLRVYEWSVPAVSLGYFQPHALAGDHPFIRRYTGGGLVDHERDVTYTIVLPRAHPWMELTAPDSYCVIHKGVQAALAACGIESELTPTTSTAESEACFAKPVKFDIVATTGEGDAGKLSGAAQRRTREGMLHQGSILLPDPAKNPALRQNFAQAFAKHMQLETTHGQLTEAELQRAIELERDRYMTDAWNRAR